MEYPSKIVEEAVNGFTRLPGIGKKTALRLVLHLLKKSREDVSDFSESITRLKTDLRYCNICNNISDSGNCFICSDDRRDHNVICVVEDIRDVMAIENTGQYKGVYHILGGLISPMDGIGPEMLKINMLIDRIQKYSPKEILFALAATMEGDTTAFYISKKIKSADLKITAIARGIAIGGELEYADQVTLGRSILGRIPFKV